MSPLPAYRAERILGRDRHGSSSPVVAETEAGRFFVKLRGAAQGVPPLIAEIVVAELAMALGLPVPERVLIELDARVPSLDRNDELLDLLARSYGQNLGSRVLPGASDLGPHQLVLIEPELAALIVWLDALVLNPDRTPQNPNILLWHRRPWLIDHGAALSFHYDWSDVDEQAPRAAGPARSAHVLSGRALPLERVDETAAAALSREVLEAALAQVPDAFLDAAFPGHDTARLRAAYVAFLWKRLKPPRPFVAA
jgi:hypothetical protein